MRVIHGFHSKFFLTKSVSKLVSQLQLLEPTDRTWSACVSINSAILPADLPIAASVRPMLDEVDNRLWYTR